MSSQKSVQSGMHKFHTLLQINGISFPSDLISYKSFNVTMSQFLLLKKFYPTMGERLTELTQRKFRQVLRFHNRLSGVHGVMRVFHIHLQKKTVSKLLKLSEFEILD